ncbi:MAG TPA: Fic family protein [Flavobacteriaceae bacterium]|nr:Fic family protein [Flavobacteriaceae bacterium]
MIDLKDVLLIHKVLIDKFSGIKGVRDKAALESAINRPFATFDQTELYPETIDKAAAVLESIIINHPFVDGNKRTGYVLMRFVLLKDNLDIEASQVDKYNFIIAISKGEMTFEMIKNWLVENVTQKK